MHSKTGDMKDDAQGNEVIALHPAETGMQLGRALLHALHNAGISVLYQDREMKTVWARNMRAPWVSDTTDGSGVLPAAQADRIGAAKRDVIASGNPQRLEISVPAEDGFRWFQVWVDADHGDGGSVQGTAITKQQHRVDIALAHQLLEKLWPRVQRLRERHDVGPAVVKVLAAVEVHLRDLCTGRAQLLGHARKERTRRTLQKQQAFAGQTSHAAAPGRATTRDPNAPSWKA